MSERRPIIRTVFGALIWGGRRGNAPPEIPGLVQHRTAPEARILKLHPEGVNLLPQVRGG